VSWFDRYVWRRPEQRETLEQLLAAETIPTYAGVPVGTDQALRLSAVWACVRLPADAVSTLPLDVYRRGERDPLPELPPLLRQPAAGMSLNEWLYAVMVSLLLRGNAHGIVTGRSGSTLLPVQCDLAHPDRLGVTVLPDGRVQYRLNGKELDPADVWHVRAYAFPGTVLGLSPVEYARQTIGLGLGAEKFAAQFFGDGSIPSGVIYADRDPKKEGAAKLKAEWMAARKNNREPAVLSGARFEPIQVRPEESQFLATLDSNVMPSPVCSACPRRWSPAPPPAPWPTPRPRCVRSTCSPTPSAAGWSGWRTPLAACCPRRSTPGSTPPAWSASTSRPAMRPTRSPSGPGS
jgi:phage portal protein BeeE